MSEYTFISSIIQFIGILIYNAVELPFNLSIMGIAFFGKDLLGSLLSIVTTASWIGSIVSAGLWIIFTLIPDILLGSSDVDSYSFKSIGTWLDIFYAAYDLAINAGALLLFYIYLY